MSQNRIAQLLGDKLHGVGAQLQTPDGRVAVLKGCVGLLRRMLRWATIGYLLTLLGMCLMMRWVGEQNVFFAFCLYLPPLLWYLPAFALLPACLVIWEWRALVMAVVCITASVFLFLGYRTGGGMERFAQPSGAAAGGRLVVLSNNRGQHGGDSMKPFKQAVGPDIMALQEAGGLAARYLADPFYAEFKHGQSIGEFTLVSRHPILSTDLVVLPVPALNGSSAPKKTESVPVAARSVVDVDGRHVVIYNVHLPTPRETLLSYRKGGFLYGLIGVPGTSLGDRRREYQQAWDQRIELVRQLLEKAAKETDPTLLAGDFNMPNLGYCHQLVTAAFQDAHSAAGAGFGFTFPGSTRNPLALGAPWLRIDYVFADPSRWIVHASVAEPNRASQHRATAAALQLRPAPAGK